MKIHHVVLGIFGMSLFYLCVQLQTPQEFLWRTFVHINGDAEQLSNTQHLISHHANSEKQDSDTNDNVVHILTTLNEKMLVGLPPLINSVLSSTKQPVQFHVIWGEDNATIVKQYLSCFDIAKYDPSHIDVSENAKKFMTPTFWSYLDLTRKAHSTLANCANILRLQAHRIFPYLDKVLWLDIDMIVQGDVGELWNLHLRNEWIMSAKRETLSESLSTYKNILKDSILTRKTYSLYKRRYGQTLDPNAYAFNNAVSLLNLKKWRLKDEYLQTEYKFWMFIAHKLKKLPGRKWWFMSSQSIMWFTYRKQVSTIPYKGWHCDGLGWHLRSNVSWEMAETAKLLHWNGEEKPWMNSEQVHYSLWSRHKPEECHGHDVLCTRMSGTSDGLFYKCFVEQR